MDFKRFHDFREAPRLFGILPDLIMEVWQFFSFILLEYFGAIKFASWETPVVSQNQSSEILTKERILFLLSSRLSCSQENLKFLFEPTHQFDSMINEISIPDGRQVLRTGSLLKVGG